MSARLVAERFTSDEATIEAILAALSKIHTDHHEGTVQAVDRYITVARSEGVEYDDALIVRAFSAAVDAILDAKRIKPLENGHAPGRFRDAAIGAADFLLREYPTPRPLFGEVMCAGDFGVLYGKPGSGKTWVGAGIGLALTQGLGYLGVATNEQRGRVGFLELELHAKRLQDRIRSMLNGSHGDPATNAFEVVSRPDIRGIVNLLDDLDFRDLEDWISHSHLDLLIVDALSRVHTVNENDATDFAPVLARCDQLRHDTGCTILLIHHEPKGNTGGKDAREDIDALRGTSRLSSDPNVLMRIVKMPGGKMRSLRFVKVNGAAEPDPIFFMLDEAGIPQVCDSPAAKGAKNRERVQAALEAAGEAGMSCRELAEKVGLGKSAAAAHANALGAESTGKGAKARFILATDRPVSGMSDLYDPDNRGDMS